MTAAELVRRGVEIDDSEEVERRHTSVVYQLDLDEELLAHLPILESWNVLQAEGFHADLISDPEIQAIYEWQAEHNRVHGQLATAAVLADQFDIDFREPDTAIGDLLDRLRERYMKNQGRKRLRYIVEDVYKEDPLAVPPALIKVGRELSQLLVSKGEMYGSGDFDRTLAHYHKKAEKGNGPSFGHPALDDYFNFMHGITFLLAPPKSYKSWWCVQCTALNILQGKSVWLIPLEMPAVETNQRLYHMLGNVPWWKYVHNKLSDQDISELRDASEYADGSGVYKMWKPPHGERDLDDIVNRARDGGADLVIIDQLQYLEYAPGKSLGEANDTGRYWGVLDRARTLSDEGPLLIAHQFHRNPGGYESMPSVDHAKGSSSIEEVATLCLGMYANKDMKRSGRLEVGALISRNAELASWAVDVNLSSGCTLAVSHRIEDDESA